MPSGEIKDEPAQSIDALQNLHLQQTEKRLEPVLQPEQAEQQVVVEQPVLAANAADQLPPKLEEVAPMELVLETTE